MKNRSTGVTTEVSGIVSSSFDVYLLPKRGPSPPLPLRNMKPCEKPRYMGIRAGVEALHFDREASRSTGSFPRSILLFLMNGTKKIEHDRFTVRIGSHPKSQLGYCSQRHTSRRTSGDASVRKNSRRPHEAGGWLTRRHYGKAFFLPRFKKQT